MDISIMLKVKKNSGTQIVAAIGAALLFVTFFAPSAFADEVFQESWGNFDASVSLGYEVLDLPAVRFATRNSYDSGSVVSTETNFSAYLDGQRLSGELAGQLGDVGGVPIRAALKGFYAGASGSQNTSCIPDDVNTYCYWPVLRDDPSVPQGLYNYFSDEIAQIVTSREADLWGLSLELQWALPNLNDINFKGGADFRHIGIDTSLDISCPTVECDAAGITSQYREGLSTSYVGGYVGLDSQIELWTNASLKLGGQIGLYSANADYSGHETQTYPGYPDDVYDLKLSRQRLAVVGTMQAELSQSIGSVTLSLFNSFEWYSWAPKMKYNNNDQTLDPPGPDGSWTGTQVGTEIGNGQMWSNTLGAKLIVMF